MYRGAAPLNWVIINGEKKTGNTTMLMDVGLRYWRYAFKR